MAPNIYPIFAVPQAEAFYPEPDALNAELKALLLRREAEGYSNPTPSLQQQAGVFESDFTLFSWQEPCIQQLRAFCWSNLGQTIQALNGYSDADMARLQIFSHTWYHVTRKGGFTIDHIHPMASWSGVYCVSPGSEVPGRPDSGALRFRNPHYYSSVFLDAGNLRPKAPYNHGSWSVKFKAGQLVLFPSWLSHEVMPYFGEDERITIAFNCWFKMHD